ncbi:MAG: mannonate dehydratase [Gemmatimonas sp.]|nr:mannonate dehydratase [Gemmatimonas sp.]
MLMTFRWYGPDDPVPLAHIRQIPGIQGVVAALYHLPAGKVWAKPELVRLGELIEAAGLRFSVVESIPVHDDIKLGRPTRDRLIENYCQSVRNMGDLGIGILCYNFMPVFDWTRTSIDLRLEDGSTTLAYDPDELSRVDPSRGPAALPAWSLPAKEDLPGLLAAFRQLDEERLWENLSYFLEVVVPVAEAAGVRMAIHPDDPPWSVFGLPRIITDAPALERLVGLVDSPANGVTFCTGSLGTRPDNDLPALVRRLGPRIHFAHCRNVQVTGEKRFFECPHPSRWGSVDFLEVLRALRDVGFAGPMRPDHGRMIWGEVGQPGYGLYDRALGAMYLQGLWEGIDAEFDATGIKSPANVADAAALA